jgi:Flp pilus assembly pilin Flp
MKTQRGAAMVEFALIALIFFMVLLGIIEFARAMFTWNTLVEATRRGARVAAVCPVSPSGIELVKEATLFDNTPGDGSDTSLFGLAANNIDVIYLDEDMNIVTPPADDDVANEAYDTIQFVQVEIANNLVHNLIIPGFNSINVPPIRTVLPSESLGRVTADNPVNQRACYGVCVGSGCA